MSSAYLVIVLIGPSFPCGDDYDDADCNSVNVTLSSTVVGLLVTSQDSEVDPIYLRLQHTSIRIQHKNVRFVIFHVVTHRLKELLKNEMEFK